MLHGGTCYLRQKLGTSSATQRQRSIPQQRLAQDEQWQAPSHSGTGAPILYASKEDSHRTSPQNPRQPPPHESAQGRSPKFESCTTSHRTKHTSKRWLCATSHVTPTAAALFIVGYSSIDSEEIQAYPAQPSNPPAVDANPEVFHQLFFFFRIGMTTRTVVLVALTYQALTAVQPFVSKIRAASGRLA